MDRHVLTPEYWEQFQGHRVEPKDSLKGILRREGFDRGRILYLGVFSGEWYELIHSLNPLTVGVDFVKRFLLYSPGVPLLADIRQLPITHHSMDIVTGFEPTPLLSQYVGKRVALQTLYKIVRLVAPHGKLVLFLGTDHESSAEFIDSILLKTGWRKKVVDITDHTHTGLIPSSIRVLMHVYTPVISARVAARVLKRLLRSKNI